MPASVFIPTLGLSPVLPDLLRSLSQDEVSEVLIGDNGMSELARSEIDLLVDDLGDRFQIVELRDYGIYSMWNAAVSRVLSLEDPYVAILNDDIVLLPGSIAMMRRAFSLDHTLALSCPDHHRPTSEGLAQQCKIRHVTGTYREGGVCGFAFMVDAMRYPKIDNRLQVWYGDDDLVRKIGRAGWNCGRVEGVPIDHLQSVSINQAPWVAEAIASDTALWRSLSTS